MINPQSAVVSMKLAHKGARCSISARLYRAKEGRWFNLGVVAHPEEPNRVLRAFKRHVLGYHFATVLTQAGEEWATDVLDATISNQASFTQYIGWGTGAGTAAKGDTTLFTEASEARVSATRSQPAADKNRYVATITADGTKTITNAGVLSASAAGTLIVHGDHAGQAVALNDSIQYTIDWEHT